MKCRSIIFSLSTILLASTALAAPALATECEALWDYKIANSDIHAVQTNPAGLYRTADGTVLDNMPTFCRVAVAAHPTKDSNIEYEVWMPSSSWNGKFVGVGNGGFQGSISYGAMANMLKAGYAVANTNTGHWGSDGTFAYRHPEKIIDFGYRAVHLMTEQSKLFVKAFYSKGPSRSYFTGCSQGGRQGILEAQRYPEDYDGIIVGAPGYNTTNHYIGGHLYLASVLYDKGPNSILPDWTAAVVGKVLNESCDANDGLKDGIISNPGACKFNPEALLCKSGQAAKTCLSPEQVDAVKKFYAGPGDRIPAGYYPGFDLGGEADNWPNTLSSDFPYGGEHGRQGFPFFKYFVFNDPNWDLHSWKWTKESIDYVEKKEVVPGQTIAYVLNATDPDLEKFKARGGKIMHYHGLGDPDIPAKNSLNYYDNVVADQGKKHSSAKAQAETDGFYRLFMVPSMGHCRRGPGPNTFDMMPALDAWVEKGIAPTQVVATKYVDDKPTAGVKMTRPICPYPQVAHYKGTGDTNIAENFVCAAPKK
jgi:feruloyl esterase